MYKRQLYNRYAKDGITPSEVDSVILMLRNISGTIYEANKAVFKLLCDGFILNREDRTQKDLYIELIDFDTPENNIFKVVNQFEIEGVNNQLRIPDGIVFINGIPVVVLEFKSAVQENTTIMDAYKQLTIRYRRDIPEILDVYKRQEEALWKSADKLRGSVEPAEYKHVVLSLFFLKFASDKFDECRNKIIAAHGERYKDMKPFYTQENVFYLPEESRWKYIIENAKQDDIALKIDTALYTIEKNNPSLKGALPDNYYSRLHIDTAKLASLLDEINRINTDDKENDIIGRIYEYFLSKFALAEGKGKGEFYTPKCIVNLIAEMLEPYDGILYDLSLIHI